MAIVVTTTPAHIAVDMGKDPATLTSLDTAQLQRWIDDAALLITNGIGDVIPNVSNLDYVVRQAVLMVADAPGRGVLSESVQIDDGQYTTRYERAPRRVTITPEWWAMLGVATGKGSAFSISMEPASLTTHADTCSLYFGATYCSCGADIAGFPLFESP